MASFGGGQDWDNVVFSKKGVKKTGQSNKQHINSQMRAGNVMATKKMGKSNNASVSLSGRVGGEQNMCKLETDNESTKHVKVSRELSKAIAAARMAKSMTQKQLATQLNVKPKMISDYESGKAIPNPQFIVKIERKLGCKLPRPKKSGGSGSVKKSAIGGSRTSGTTGVIRKKKRSGKKGPAVNNIMGSLRISR
jgi:putative transcription factor|tara:strand:- start:24 stop:605 length:582 start_codon:yes stop_codon:yes gene_type:complete